ncbi:hypothetical protein WISP_13543 [Willisornis vidua]|uniref:Spatacsin C-terminal domain-containing protein n=1 Tax=Willisornis vidua TaxID=1566151 RepID=A0ABQ9DUY6_9PASS|nr:hypothetical protein WISP_13543 [Willisornis vidua]
MAVVLSAAHCALAVGLNSYFRSWKAHLSSLWDRVRRRRPGSPDLVDDLNLPWYQFFTHLEDHDPEVYEDPEKIVAFVPRVTWAASRPFQSHGTALGGAGQQWTQIPVGAPQELVKLECKLVTGAKAVFVVVTKDMGCSLVLWDLESQDVTSSHFGTSSVYVECSAEVPLCLLLTERGLSLVLFGVTQEEFLNRLMMFGSAAVVDSICHLNGWERCSIPIHALEAGLENRQLDTVDLFLKSKASVCSLSAPCPGQSSSAASQAYLANLEELRPAINLLCSAIQESDMEPSSKPFSEQLLNLTLTFLTRQLEEIFVHTEEPDEFLQKAADILTDYIIKLRKFLRKYPQINPVHTGGDGDEDLPEIQESHEWEKLTPEEVIAQAILSNKIPEAQIFFRVHQHPAENLQEFIQTGLNLVYDCLLKDNTREASELLRNMGFDVKEELHKICFHTEDKHVRDLLVKVLREENYFSEKEKKMIDFVHQVESFYSDSFQENKEVQSLSRKGIFVPSELEDFELLLQRLSCLGGVLQNPHPVPKYSSASGLDFHAQFVLHCLEHNLQYLLYTYLDYHSLTPANCPILDNKELQEAHPWFEFLVQCRGVASNPQDPRLVFQASLANAQVLIPGSQASVSSILLEGRTLLALATTMYCPGGIDQVLQNEDPEKSLKKVDPQLLKMALTPYPKLKAALFPSCTAHGILPPDISLYHLLQSLVPFDPTKLFGWQSANTLAASDAPSELPHFSCPGLVNRHAVLERLDFLFYLHHARPSFAFGTFLAQQLAKSKSPKQLLQQAGREAHALALSSFSVPSVGAACVCFLELLGLDSLKLRVDLKVANMIFSYRTRKEESHHNQIRDSLVEKLTKLAGGDKAAAAAVLPSLEEAFWDAVERQGIQRTCSDSRRQWALVMQFCKLHSLELSTSYLRECARAGDWLQFLLQSHLQGHQPGQVMSILQDFPPTLQDHLVLALGKCLSAEGRAVGQGRSAESLFQVLLQCQGSGSPWQALLAAGLGAQARVLSVLAACVPGANIIPCLCVWIITSVGGATRAEATKHLQSSAESHQWGLQDLSVIWKVLLRKQKSKTLLNGFQLFLKDSPLLHILEMYELCMNCKKYNEAKTKLDKFQESLTKLRTEAEAAPELPVPWLECQALFLLELMLQQCRTEYELGKLLQLFAAAENLLLDGPYVRKLCALSETLRDSSIPINSSILTLRSCSLEAFQGECRSILEQLQDRGMFSLAREVAALAELPVDRVVTREVLRDLHRLREGGQWHQGQTRAEFWRKCNDTFLEHSISSQAAAGFFLDQANTVLESSGQEKTTSILERHLLLTLAGHWLAKDTSVSLQELEAVEKQIWLCRIAQRVFQAAEGSEQPPSASPAVAFASLAQEFSFSKLPALSCPQQLQLEALVPGEGLAGAEAAALQALAGALLDEGSVHEASRVCRYFQCCPRDLALVLLCRALASGQAGLGKLHPGVQALLAGLGHGNGHGHSSAECPGSQEGRAPGRQKQALNPAVESQALLELAKLCQDHTLVGMKLLDKIPSVPRGELSCITELLILAHSCFSLTCHMEGITRVLQAARLLTDQHLAPQEEYGLLVRLLTGIGRYNEMSYIFELLHERQHFEVLMRKKLDPSGTLKRALLEYIKRCRPGDSEKHNMIALCFSMCREIGENHEAAARTQLKLIASRPWEESLQDVANLKKLLLKALTLFIDAAESYSKDSCVRQALRCRRLTRLITLQLHFLGSGQSTRIINLGRQDLLDAILALPRFYQAQRKSLWVPGQLFCLSYSTIIVPRVKQHPPADAAVKNLRRFLAHCEDIYTHYRLAYEHRFYEVANALLKDPQTGCCLNDLLSS